MTAATNIAAPELATLAPVLVQENGHEFRTRIGSISQQSFVYFAGTILTAASGYFFKIYLARKLGAEALGIYALGMTIVGFVGVFNSLGLPTAAARFVAAYSAKGERRKLASFLRGSLTLLTVINVALGAVVLFAGRWLAVHFYHAPKLNSYLWTFAAIMILGVVNMFLGQVMSGFRDVARRTIVTHFLGTPANIVIAIILISFGFGLSGYLAAQVTSAALVFCLLGLLVWKRMPRSDETSSIGLRLDREVLNFSAVAYGIAGLQFVLAQADMIVLGHALSAREVGIYAVAMALVGFVPVALDSVNQIFSPIISELHASRNHAMLQQLYSTLTKWILVLTLPLALTMIVFSGGLMAIFGPAFRTGAVVLVMGAFAQLFNCAVGSVGYLLLMSGNQAELIKIHAVNAALLLALNIGLVPRIGITGAAIAAMLTTITTNLWGLASVRRILKLSPYNFGYLKLLFGAVASTAGLVVLSHLFGGAPRQWAVAGAGLVFAYAIFFATIVLLGLDHEDRTLAKFAWARVGQNFRRMVVA